MKLNFTTAGDFRITMTYSVRHIYLSVQLKDQGSKKREILSYMNSLYDPLGIINLVIRHGKCILREVMSISLGWGRIVPLSI